MRPEYFIYNVEDILCAIEGNHFVEVVRIDQEIVVEIKLGRLEENGALVFSKRHVVVDRIVHISMVDRYLTVPNRHLYITPVVSK